MPDIADIYCSFFEELTTVLEDTNKEASVLPAFLAKPRRGERLEPGSDDFAKNQAFGRAVGGGGVPGAFPGAIAGGVLGSHYLGTPGMVLGAGAGMALGMGAGTALAYPSKLRKQREIAEKIRSRKS